MVLDQLRDYSRIAQLQLEVLLHNSKFYIYENLFSTFDAVFSSLYIQLQL